MGPLVRIRLTTTVTAVPINGVHAPDKSEVARAAEWINSYMVEMTRAGWDFGGMHPVDVWCRLYEVTEGWTDADGRLHCGRCGRVVARLYAGAEMGTEWPSVTPSGGHSGNGPNGPSERKVTSQSQGKGLENRFRLACHPKRCGAVHVVRVERLTLAFISAARAGRRDLVVGDGRYALSRGGPDL